MRLVAIDVLQKEAAAPEIGKEFSAQQQLDLMDDEIDSYHGSFTRNDRRDMGRMGKVQELKASTRSPRGAISADLRVEKLQTFISVGLYRGPSRHLGSTISASQPRQIASIGVIF